MSDDGIDLVLAEIRRLAERVDGLAGELSALRVTVTDFRAEWARERGEMMARMDRLQDGLTMLQEDIVVNMGAAQRAELIARGARDTLRSEWQTDSEQVRLMADQVNAMQRQIVRINGRLDNIQGRPSGA